MEMLNDDHHLRMYDNDTFDLHLFSGKLPFKKWDDTYRNSAAKIDKDDGASQNIVRRPITEKFRKKGAVLEQGEGSWMIIETANDGVESCIESRHHAHFEFRLGGNGSACTEWFTMFNEFGIDIVLLNGSVCDTNILLNIDRHETKIQQM